MRGMKDILYVLILFAAAIGFGCVEHSSSQTDAATVQTAGVDIRGIDAGRQTVNSGTLTGEPGRYVLNMYHFNLQYVAGCDVCMERVILSFEPLVDFYIAHPEYGADFEMQGMMIEYMAKKHPAVLEKFRNIVNSGQVALVSFHYSDQLLLAYPAHDQQWSIKINDKIMAENGIVRSGTIFAQEAMFSEGIANMGANNAYKVAVMTGGNYGWFQDSGSSPYYTCRGLKVLKDSSTVFPNSGIEAKWEFVGDGETVTSFDPYFPVLKPYVKLCIANLDKKFKNYVDEGYKIAKVSELIDALDAAGERPVPLKPILDTPWRPGDGSGVFQWMGEYVFPWEEDYTLLTGNWTARSCLMAFESKYGEQYPEKVEEAWRHLLEAEVSDSTGWRPMFSEIAYTKEHADAVLAIIQSIDPSLLSNAWTRPELTPENSGPVDVKISGNLKKKEIKWYSFPGQENVWVMDVNLERFILICPGLVSIDFPYDSEFIEYSPAMLEDEVRTISINDIKHNPIHLGIPNGLIGLGGGSYLVRDNNYGVLALKIDIDGKKISCQALNPTEKEIRFRFYIIKGDPQTALIWANMINNINL
jgi:hypothetical protein